MKDTKLCAGCRNNFYNDGNNSLGVKQCWSAPKAEIVTRFRLHRDTPMWFREAYVKVRVPDCFHETGWVFLKQIPDSARTRQQRQEIEAREAKEAA